MPTARHERADEVIQGGDVMVVVLPAFRRTQLRARLRPALTALWSAAVIAIGINFVVVAVGSVVNGRTIAIVIDGMPSEVGWFQVTAASALAAIVGAVGAWLSASLLRRGLLVFSIVAALVGAASLLAVTLARTFTGAIVLAIVIVLTTTVVIWVNTDQQSRATRRPPDRAS